LVDSNEQNENPGEEELARSRAAELESLVAERDREISLANIRISELEQTVANLEGEVAALNQSSLESEQKLAEASDALSQAIASYKARITESNPEIPAELIDGDTIEDVDSSLERARAIIQKIREGLEADIKMVRVPAGAPPRAPIDLSTLSPLEKIQYGIGGKR
jgi:phage-related minor tail protein